MDRIEQLIATRQLSIYFLLGSLVVSAAMMHPGVTTLMLALPIEAAALFGLRWVAHREGEHQ